MLKENVQNRMKVSGETNEKDTVMKENIGRVLSFIEWSQTEGRQLEQFEALLCQQLILTPAETTKILSNLKIDYQLYHQILSMSKQIKANTHNFATLDRTEYAKELQTGAYTKTGILMRTSADDIKVVCEAISFLHFVSCNLSSYRKILQAYDSRNLTSKLLRYATFPSACILKQKLFTVLSLIHIKFDSNSEAFVRLLSQAVANRVTAFRDYPSEKAGSSKSKILRGTTEQESLTIFLAYQLIDMKAKKIEQSSQPTEDTFELLTLITKYEKIFCSNSQSPHGALIDSFLTKMDKIKSSLALHNKKTIIKSYDQEAGELQCSRAGRRVKSCDIQETSKLRKESSLKKALEELFFKNNAREIQERSKVKTAIWIRKGRSSQMRDRVMAYTFQNAKNALRRIEFEMKANNNQLLRERGDESKLVKKKMKKGMYDKFRGNRNILADVTSNRLVMELDRISRLKIWDPLAKIQENKKAIIEHKFVHKDQGAQKNRSAASQGSAIGVIKYILGVPTLLSISMRPNQKAYLMKVETKIGKDDFSFEFSLPRSTNIFTDRYQTIWPTIKYLLKKKIMAYEAFKANEECFSVWDSVVEEEKKHVMVKEEGVSRLFGQIEQEELQQISGALGYLSKLIDFLLCKRRVALGWVYTYEEIIQGQNATFCLRPEPLNNHHLIKEQAAKVDPKLSWMKKSLLFSMHPVNLVISHFILKTKELVSLSEREASGFFLVEASIQTNHLICSLVGALKFAVLLRICRVMQQEAPQSRHRVQSHNIEITVEELLSSLRLDPLQYGAKVLKFLQKRKLDSQMHDFILSLCFQRLPDHQKFYSPSFYLSGRSGHTPFRSNRLIDCIATLFLKLSPPVPSQGQVTVIENCLGLGYRTKVGLGAIEWPRRSFQTENEFHTEKSAKMASVIQVRPGLKKVSEEKKSCFTKAEFFMYSGGKKMLVMLRQRMNGSGENQIEISVRQLNDRRMSMLLVPEKVFAGLLASLDSDHSIVQLLAMKRATIIPKLRFSSLPQSSNQLSSHSEKASEDFQRYLMVTPRRWKGAYVLMALKVHRRAAILEFQLIMLKKNFTICVGFSVRELQRISFGVVDKIVFDSIREFCLQPWETDARIGSISSSELGGSSNSQSDESKANKNEPYVKSLKQLLLEVSFQFPKEGGILGRCLSFVSKAGVKILEHWQAHTETLHAVFYENSGVRMGLQFLKDWDPNFERRENEYGQQESLFVRVQGSEVQEVRKSVRRIISELEIEKGSKVSVKHLARQLLLWHLREDGDNSSARVASLAEHQASSVMSLMGVV